MFRTLATVVVALLPACSVGDLELAGRECPCIEGWVCDAAQDVCVPVDAGVAMDALAPTDGGDASSDVVVADTIAPVDAQPDVDSTVRDAQPDVDSAVRDAAPMDTAEPPPCPHTIALATLLAAGDEMTTYTYGADPCNGLRLEVIGPTNWGTVSYGDGFAPDVLYLSTPGSETVTLAFVFDQPVRDFEARFDWLTVSFDSVEDERLSFRVDGMAAVPTLTEVSDVSFDGSEVVSTDRRGAGRVRLSTAGRRIELTLRNAGTRDGRGVTFVDLAYVTP